MRMAIFMISDPWDINLVGLDIHGLLQLFLDFYEYPLFSYILQLCACSKVCIRHLPKAMLLGLLGHHG